LFDPFKEQLDLPATFIDERNGQCGETEVIGQKDQVDLTSENWAIENETLAG
jgi:hypothetical protein